RPSSLPRRTSRSGRWQHSFRRRSTRCRDSVLRMRALTVEEARQRAADITVRGYQVDFDLTGPGDTFVTTSRIRFRADGDSTWAGVKPERLISVEHNGRQLDVAALDGGRFPLENLPAENELVVVAEMRYSADGEGLQRSVDAADGRVYTYGMSS